MARYPSAPPELQSPSSPYTDDSNPPSSPADAQQRSAETATTRQLDSSLLQAPTRQPRLSLRRSLSSNGVIDRRLRRRLTPVPSVLPDEVPATRALDQEGRSDCLYLIVKAEMLSTENPFFVSSSSTEPSSSSSPPPAAQSSRNIR